MTNHLDRKVSTIVQLALDQNELNGIVRVLKVIADSLDACCCILWETDPWVDTKADPPTGNLYVFARWICDEIEMPLKELPIDSSINGLAIVTNQTQKTADVRDNKDAYTRHNWIYDEDMTSMCAVPIKFDSEIINATLSVYRRLNVNPFTEEEQKFIEQIALLIPPLYQAIRDKVGRKLLSEINEIIDKAEMQIKVREKEETSVSQLTQPDSKSRSENDGLTEVTKALEDICLKVAETFQCVETSLFLENKLENENQFKLVATNFDDWTSAKKTYSSERDSNHLTGWVLKNQTPVNIFDLGNFEKDKEKLQEKYHDINWKDSLKIKRAAGQILNLPVDDNPTLSFMAVPIKKGNELLGVIRCCTAMKDPWFFADRQLDLLQMVAVQISRFWSWALQHLEEKKEIKVWETFIKKISELNAKVQKRIDKSDVDEEELYRQILELAKSSIKNSDILSIRLRDDKTNQLYFAKIHGLKKKLSKVEIQTRETKRFSLEKSCNKNVPLGVLVFQEGVGRSVMNADLENYKSETFPETKRIIITPIGIQKEIQGILDIRGTSDKPFPPHALQMATLLGQQLGLYLSLWESEKQQRQVFEDLFHQTKSPVRQIFARTLDLLQSIDYEKWDQSNDEIIVKIKDKTLMLRGVARKAQKVIFNAGVFKELSNDGKLKLTEHKIKRLLFNETIKLLIEAFQDTKLLLDSSQNIKFYVERNGLEQLDNIHVKVDMDFFEQAINCLLDNAGKYSFENTTVRISAGEVKKDQNQYFSFAVNNEGFEIKAENINKIKERYYRGVGAKDSTGEGSGIGLWVVDHIMSAHEGELDINQTDSNGRNEIRLLFPISGR